MFRFQFRIIAWLPFIEAHIQIHTDIVFTHDNLIDCIAYHRFR